MLKECSKCKKIKELSEFYKTPNQKSGYYPSCKCCKKELAKDYVRRNPEDKKRRDAAYKLKRPDVTIAARKKYYYANKNFWTIATSKRRSAKLNRTPSWLTDKDFQYINYLYKFARNISDYLGKEYHIDHIIPLQGRLVSGLHVPSNLQMIPATINLQKGNKWQIY